MATGLFVVVTAGLIVGTTTGSRVVISGGGVGTITPENSKSFILNLCFAKFRLIMSNNKNQYL